MKGRPTKYSQKILDKAKGYLFGYEAVGDAVPSIAGLSVELGVARSTIYEWAKDEDKQEFSDILDTILQTQERVAISKGLLSEFNPTIVKLLLGKHGYSDKAQHEHSGPEGGPVQVSRVEIVPGGQDS